MNKFWDFIDIKDGVFVKPTEYNDIISCSYFYTDLILKPKEYFLVEDRAFRIKEKSQPHIPYTLLNKSYRCCYTLEGIINSLDFILKGTSL